MDLERLIAASSSGIGSVRACAATAGRFRAASVVAALVASGAVSAGAAAHPSVAAVTVVVRPAGCSVSARKIEAGQTRFTVVNRSSRPASFAIGSTRIAVAGDRRVRRSIRLSPGRQRYSCMVAHRRVGTGLVLVAARSAPPPQHRVALRTVGGIDELYDRATGQRIVLRGNDYHRVDPAQTGTDQITFEVGRYDGARAEAAFAAMEGLGYNVVRVFMSGECPTGCIGDPVTRRLSTAYLANVADFLRRAARHHLYVILTMGFLPTQTVYDDLLNRDTSALVQNVNINYLTAGGIEAWQLFWQDVIKGLRAQGAPLDDVLAYDIRNELNYVNDAPPFNLTSGVLHAPDGRDYDLSSTDARISLMDDGLVYFVDQVRTAIRKVDPTALVDASFFVPEAPNPTRIGDTRILRTNGVIERSQADLVDIHIYPGLDLTLPQFMENFGISGPTRKVVIVGEYGAFRKAYGTAADALAAMKALQAGTCGYGIDGWLLWTWDTDESTERLWNAVDAGGLLADGLSPKARPDPCSP